MKWFDYAFKVVVVAAILFQSYTIDVQNRVMIGLIQIADQAASLDQKIQGVLVDHEIRISAMENYDAASHDDRLLAHIKWYIMERSGIGELVRLERAMEDKWNSQKQSYTSEPSSQ